MVSFYRRSPMSRFAFGLLLSVALLVPVSTFGQSSAGVVKKDPQLAQVLSVVVVGGGHIYAGEPGTGLTLILVPSVATVGGVLRDRHYCEELATCGRNKSYLQRNAGTLAAGALWLSSWIFGIADADNAARAYNRRHGLAVYPSRRGVTVAYAFN